MHTIAEALAEMDRLVRRALDAGDAESLLIASMVAAEMARLRGTACLH